MLARTDSRIRAVVMLVVASLVVGLIGYRLVQWQVIDQDGLQVALGFDHRQRFLRGGDAQEADTERVVERARRGVEALHELPQHEVLVVDHQNAARGLGH